MTASATDWVTEAVVAFAISTFSAKSISLKASNAFSASLGSVVYDFVTISVSDSTADFSLGFFKSTCLHIWISQNQMEKLIGRVLGPLWILWIPLLWVGAAFDLYSGQDDEFSSNLTKRKRDQDEPCEEDWDQETPTPVIMCTKMSTVEVYLGKSWFVYRQ